MGLIDSIKEWVNMMFFSKAREEFTVKSITSPRMDALIKECASIYSGKPYWLNADDNIKTVNFAKSLCSETARLATLGIKVTVDGSARADWIQEQIEKVYFQLRHWVEYGGGFGTIVLKPNGKSIDVYTPKTFRITSQENGDITGIVFQQQEQSNDGKYWYTRLEYHRTITLDNGEERYMVSNRTYISESQSDIGKPYDMKKTPWAGLEEEVAIQNADGRLYAVLKMPAANNVDVDSPLGVPIFLEAIEELRDLDIAYSRNALEIEQSRRTILLDSDRLMTGGKTKVNGEAIKTQMGLPDMVKMVEGMGSGDFYQEINPTMQTGVRIDGINALLSQIGYKVGFSNGYFVFNQQMGIQTATGVEAAQQRTIQFIKDVRDRLESCLNELIYALNAFADAYDLAPVGDYEVNYDFGDITYNYEEDRARWWGYVLQGRVPAWMYFQKFEGMTEDEAKAMATEMESNTNLVEDEE